MPPNPQMGVWRHDWTDCMTGDGVLYLSSEGEECMSDLFPDVHSFAEASALAERFDILSKRRTHSGQVDLVDLVEQEDHEAEAWLLDQEPMVTLLGGRQLHYSPDLSREEIDVLVASQSPEEQDRRFQGYLPPHNTFVVGGLIDRNQHKGVTHDKAVQLGLRTVRLPIQDFVHLRASCVLTCNQVYEILTLFHSFGSWEYAVRTVIPPRKIHSPTPPSPH